MVADDFKFNFLPAGNGAFNEDLTNEAVLEPLRADIVEFSIVVGNAAARTAQCIGRTHNERIADAVGKFLCRGNAFHNRALRNGLMEFSIVSLKSSRSSAFMMLGIWVPMSFTLYF